MKDVLTPMDLLEDLPPGINVLIVGPPGSGKTILSQQLVYRALRKGKSAVYMASKSHINQITSQNQLFNWDITPYARNKQIGVVELGDITDPTELNISLSRTINELREPPSLVVVDSLTVLMVIMEQKKIMRFTEGLTRKFHSQNVNLLFLTTPTKETEDFLTKMKSLVSSVIEINLRERETIRRFMRIFKFSERRHSTLWYSFDITDRGIQFAASSVKTPDTYLFDLDGTLITMELDFEQIRENVDAILLEKGFPEEFLDDALSTLEMITRAVSYLKEHNLDWEGAQKAAEQYLGEQEQDAASRAVVIEGAEPVLKVLKELKKKVGVITRNNRKVALQVLKECGLHKYVDVLLTRDDVDRVKPHPDHIIQAMKELDSSPERTVVLGDHHFEIEAGNKAGCFTVGVLTGSGTKKTLKDADVILNSIKDLGEVLTSVEQ